MLATIWMDLEVMKKQILGESIHLGEVLTVVRITETGDWGIPGRGEKGRTEELGFPGLRVSILPGEDFWKCMVGMAAQSCQCACQ